MAESVRNDPIAMRLPASYGAARFLFESSSVVGGRRATERPILNSDEQLVSDVGLRQRAYALRGWVAAREAVGEEGLDSETYKAHRDALLAAFEDPTPKVLVHPIEGAIPGLVARSFSIDEAENEWGIGRVSVELIRDTRRATPVVVTAIAADVVARAEESKATTLQALAERWSIDPAVVGSYEDGLAKARAAFEQVATIANEAETLTDAADRLASVVSEGVAAATATIAVPQRLVTDLGAAFVTLASAFPNVYAAFEGMILGFDFGDFDAAIDLTVPSAASRKRNADAMNVAVKAHLLADAYAFASGLDFVRLDEIDRVEGLLNDQLEAIHDLGTAAPEVLDGLEETRSAFSALLDRARLTARRVVPEHVAPMTPRTLSFALYGDDSLADTLAGLNGRFAYQTLSGAVSVLSS